jgi:hypothetical protein
MLLHPAAFDLEFSIGPKSFREQPCKRQNEKNNPTTLLYGIDRFAIDIVGLIIDSFTIDESLH